MRARLITQGSVDAIVGFDNAEGIFPIHRGFRFNGARGVARRAAARDSRAVRRADD
jgi:hypothetical protein